MARARLVLDIPRDVWIGDLSRSYPGAEIRILAALPHEGAGVGLAEIRAADPEAVIDALGSRDAVVALDVLGAGEDEVLVQFETDRPLLLVPVRESGVPLEMPFEIVDGEAVWEVTAPQRRLSELGEQLEAFGIDFTVERLRQHVERGRLLTERQRRLVEAAVDRGYYDTPRDCSLTELADDLGLAKSTVSETLHRAEGRIVKAFVGEGADRGISDRVPSR